MATTLRIPEALSTEAHRYAAALGLSLNGLVAVALREYLDARRYPEGQSQQGSNLPKRYSDEARAAQAQAKALRDPDWLPEEFREAQPSLDRQSQQGSEPAASVAPAKPNRYPRPPAGGRSAPCPCGAPFKWKQCHGRNVKEGGS